jgi:ABC-type Fe3+/spermidine/putrescine transport system ATPase subunit
MQINSDKILEVSRVTNHYDGEPLLEEISFSLEKGEILCLLGPSGSGKTTLLRLLAGLENEESGTILFQGRNIKPIPPHKRKIGMMFQEYALFPHKTVWQNIAFGLEMQNCTLREQETKVSAILEMVGLAGFGNRKIDELSGGERQRVALARSLAPEPELLLLDEPLGSLDRTLRDRLTVEIRSILKALGVTAIFVTHDQAEAFSVADKVAVLQRGRLQQFDTPENLYRSPVNKAVAAFLGFTNFVEGTVDTERVFSSIKGGIIISQMAGLQRHHREVLIRPDGAVLRCGEDTDLLSASTVLSGIVRSVCFQGSTYRLSLEVEGKIFSFDLQIDPKPPGVNEYISLAIKPTALILFEK